MMTKKLLVGLFLAAFGLAMTNITLAASGDVMCTMQYDPVCGTDNKTYGNACTAGAQNVSIKYKGECNSNRELSEGEITNGTVSPEYQTVCQAGLSGIYSVVDNGYAGAGNICYNPQKGTPVCKHSAGDTEGWYYTNGSLLKAMDCYKGTSEQKACTKEYMPVCGYVEVQCVRAPCYPIATTFGNKCEAENADAKNITQGACSPGVKYNKLENTSWKLQSYNNEVATGPTLSFTDEKVSAKICNSMNGTYTVDGNKIAVGPIMSTLMFCTGPLGTYEAAFDLSGATYELSTDGANHLMLTTVKGDTFQWELTKKNPTKPVTNNSWRRYGFVIWQLNQIAKIRGFDTTIEKQAMAQGLLDKINQLMSVSLMTPLQNARWVHIKAAVQFYYDHVGDGTFGSF